MSILWLVWDWVWQNANDTTLATVLQLLGFDHERLIRRHQGRDFRLTDVHGRVVDGLLA